MVTISQMVAVFSIFANRSKLKHTSRLPRYIISLLNTRWAMQIVPIDPDISHSTEEYARKHQIQEVVEDDDASNLIESYPLLSNNWPRLAKLLQRLTFILFAIIFVILSTICFI